MMIVWLNPAQPVQLAQQQQALEKALFLTVCQVNYFSVSVLEGVYHKFIFSNFHCWSSSGKEKVFIQSKLSHIHL